MGASESLAEEYHIVDTFNKFVKDTKKSLLMTSKKNLKKLNEQSEQFFRIYESNDERNRDIIQEQINLDSYFQNIDYAMEAFKDCIDFIKTSPKKDEVATVTSNFLNDFPKFVMQITQLAKMATQILLEIRSNSMKNPLIYLELNMFDFALTVKKTDKPPYYEILILPVYQLHDKINEIESQRFSITASHGTGKTNLIPLFLACRIINNSSKSRFVILIEHETSNIKKIKDIYRQICLRESEEYDDSESLIVSSSLPHILQYYEQISSLFYPVVGILSPLDALKLIHSVPNIEAFVSKSIFIIDDVHMRTVETDVFIQDMRIPISKINNDKYLPRLILMSSIQDASYQRKIGYNENLLIDINKSTVNVDTVKCDNIKDIDKKLFKSMIKFFNKWINDSIICVGSVIIFVPSEKDGQKLYHKIFKYFRKDNATNVCPLQTTIRKGEKPDDFYVRLLNDVQVAEEERPEGTQTLFLMPMFLTENVSPEEKNLIHSQIPLLLTDKLARVFITTIKNEPILQIQDLMVIFDSGVQEVEFFDPQQSAIHVREQLLPNPFIEEHMKMLSNGNGGKYFKFKVTDDDKVRPKALIPSVKRSDLSRNLLNLRSFGIKLEKQGNLPDEPNHDILDECFVLLKKIGVIDGTKDKELTPIGVEASKFSIVSPFFAVATAKFKENQQFAFLCSLIIENSRNLITDSKSKLLCKNFNRDSDVVTLLDSVCEASEGSTIGSDDWGLSIGTLHMIYLQMENTFVDCVGRNAVIESVKWARSQTGGTIGMVDKFVSLLDHENFLNKRKAEFAHILGAGPGCETMLIYKADDIFKIGEVKEGDEIKSKIKISRRPGWIGLQSPGNVYILSLIVEEESQFNRGLIMHRDPTVSVVKPGIVSIEVDNPSLNSYFFVSLFEGYWSGNSISNNFISIYHTPYPAKESSFLIHMTNDGGKTFMNYCPKNVDTANTMRTAIPLLAQLMPYVPRSIMAKLDVPLCAVEVIGEGSANIFNTRINFIDDPSDPELPFAYPVNKETLEFAQRNINELSKNAPMVRFSITGECFYYISRDGKENDTKLRYPDVNPSIKCVFDSYHPSHLVLLVSKEYPSKPTTTPLKWLPALGDEVKITTNDIEANKMAITAASKIMNGIGYAERAADVFFVSLGNGVPTVKSGKIPDAIRNEVKFKDGAITGGIYPLIHHFLNEFTYKQELKNSIPLEKISSNDSWRNYPRDRSAQENLCKQVNTAVSNYFHIEANNVMSLFIGSSILAIRVENLPENLTAHEVNTKAFDNKYYPCIADDGIKKSLSEIKTVDFQVTNVVHEPVIKVSVCNMRRLNKTEDEFVTICQNVFDMFGFLRANKIEYIDPSYKQQKRGILGYIEAEFYGMTTGLVFATQIISQFPILSRLDLTMTRTMRTIRGIETIDPRLTFTPGDDSSMIKVTPAELEALKEQIAMKNAGVHGNKWNLDTNFNVLIIPASAEAAAKDMIRKVRNKDTDTTCLIICDPPQVFLPQSLYCYQKDGSVIPYAICRQCMIESFKEYMPDLQRIIDPITHVIIREELAGLNTQLPGIPFLGSTSEGDEMWPLVPIGQAFWALMSDPETFGPELKSWFTAVIDLTIKTARSCITFCPNHPDIPLRTPKNGKSVKCMYCNMFFHGDCREWHKMDEVCKKTVDLGLKKCPNCLAYTEKNGGCNHMYCQNCKKHWCYACVNSPIFETGDQCYKHMNAVHGGYYT